MVVIVKGAGVAGLTVACELVHRGLPAEIWEASDRIGHGASYYAGGMLAPDCEGETAPAEVVALGREAADWWETMLPGLVDRRGTLVLAPARDTADLHRFARVTGGHRHVDGDGIAALEPDLAGRFRTGLFYAGEAHLDPRRALNGLHERLLAAGVTIRVGVPADARPSDPAQLVVDCTGAAARRRLPGLRAIRGEMIYLQSAEITLFRPVRLLHPRHPIYIVPRGDGRFMVGATMVESDDSGPISARSLMEFLNSAYALHPAFGEARLVETGVGLRPAFEDNCPGIIEQPDGLAIAGLHRHGFLLSPALARRAADRLEERLGHGQPEAWRKSRCN